MTFQETVTQEEQAYGVVGEFAFDSPRRVHAYTLDSASEANNVVGRVFTVKSQGIAQAGGDNGVFAGILINPKTYAVDGIYNNDSGDLTIPNGNVVELCTMGEIYIKLGGSAAIGDALKYNDTTGVIASGSPSAGETAIPNAKVTSFTVGGAGLAVITLTN